MCAHYDNLKDPAHLQALGVSDPASAVKDVWPRYPGTMIRRHPLADVGDDAVPEREAQAALFSLIPKWAKSIRDVGATYNARSETVAVKPSFRDAWRRGQHCVIPAAAIYEPLYPRDGGKSSPARIVRADGQPLLIAGLWESWRAPDGDGHEVLSMTMLTVNADDHPFMRQFHKPEDEKRMVVVLEPEQVGDWLASGAQQAGAFMRMAGGGVLRLAPM